MYFDLVSGYLVTHEDTIFKDPLLGTFVIKDVLADKIFLYIGHPHIFVSGDMRMFLMVVVL